MQELKNRDMTQADLARATNITSAHMSRIISGERNPGKEALSNIAHALRLSPEVVLEKAGLLSPRNTRSAVKNMAIGIIDSLSEEDAAFIANFLNSYVHSKK